MELTLHKPGDHHFIRSFDANGVIVTDTLYRESLVLSADQLVSDWPVRSVAELSEEHLEAVLELEPEVVLLGTGRKQAFPAPRLLRAFFERGIGFEAMTTEAACRTFNVLVSEGRTAVAALIID
jgi:uncharacterized protein